LDQIGPTTTVFTPRFFRGSLVAPLRRSHSSRQGRRMSISAGWLRRTAGRRSKSDCFERTVRD
jgi:hypothetical protein